MSLILNFIHKRDLTYIGNVIKVNIVCCYKLIVLKYYNKRNKTIKKLKIIKNKLESCNCK
jgi:hypothetical protein